MAASHVTYYPPGSASEPDFAAITHGFVYGGATDGFNMNEAKRLATMLDGYKVSNMSWHLILNNTTSTRPKKCGGPTISSLKDCTSFHNVGDLKASPQALPGLDEYPEAWWCGALKLPNSFEMGDGRILRVTAAAMKRPDADEKVCLLAFTHLLLRGPTLVLLRPTHWRVDVTSIRQAAAAISGAQPPGLASASMPASAPPSRSQKALMWYEPPAPGGEQERDELICTILTELICNSPGGLVYPSDIKRGGWRPLRQYLPRGELPNFISEHNQFERCQVSRATWAFRFAARAAQPALADQDDPPGAHAPGSASAAGSQGGDLPAQRAAKVSPKDVAGPVEREHVRHKCVHGEWLQRAARALPAGHELAAFDKHCSVPKGFGECCRFHHRSELFEDKTGKWMVWDAEVVEWLGEDTFYNEVWVE